MAIEALKTVWPEWQIEEKPLGRGSYGVVYKALRQEFNVESHAAIKVISIPSDPSEIDALRAEGLSDNSTRTYFQGIVQDFIGEIQLMESLKGIQNIVSVEDYRVVEREGEIGWDIFIRMELLTPFGTYLRGRKLTEKEVIRLGCDICTALEICGQRNIIHRDIKPENIFINDFGHFKLGDFGIARKLENMTGGLSQKGTFHYMAPEVASGGEYDARVDTYSLGIVLYRLLNGNRPPFLNTEEQMLNPHERKNAVDRRLRGEPLPAPCEASSAMAALLLRACAYDPSQRFASATQMKQALLAVLNGTYQAAPAPQFPTAFAPAGDMDRTVSVRKAPPAAQPQAAPVVNTFGPPQKKKLLPIIIAAVLSLAILVEAGILIGTRLRKPNDDGDAMEGVTISDEEAGEGKDMLPNEDRDPPTEPQETTAPLSPETTVPAHETQETLATTPQQESSYEILRDVMNNTRMLRNEEGSMQYLREFLSMFGVSSVTSWKFMDFNGDGEDEVFAITDSPDINYLIIHWNDQYPCCFAFGFRWITELKTNGYMRGSNGASSSVYYRIIFSGNSYSTISLAEIDDEAGYYVVNGRTASRSEAIDFLWDWYYLPNEIGSSPYPPEETYFCNWCGGEVTADYFNQLLDICIYCDDYVGLCSQCGNLGAYLFEGVCGVCEPYGGMDPGEQVYDYCNYCGQYWLDYDGGICLECGYQRCILCGTWSTSIFEGVCSNCDPYAGMDPGEDWYALCNFCNAWTLDYTQGVCHSCGVEQCYTCGLWSFIVIDHWCGCKPDSGYG